MGNVDGAKRTCLFRKLRILALAYYFMSLERGTVPELLPTANNIDRTILLCLRTRVINRKTCIYQF